MTEYNDPAMGWLRTTRGITGHPNSTLPEPDPRPSAGPAVWDLVAEDMSARDRFGFQKYGTRLRPHNGRDALKDAYQEALDLCVYLRQALYERDGR